LASEGDFVDVDDVDDDESLLLELEDESLDDELEVDSAAAERFFEDPRLSVL